MRLYPQPPPPPKPVGIERRNPDIFGGELYDCDMCGKTYHKSILRKQKGYLVCTRCWDDPSYREKSS